MKVGVAGLGFGAAVHVPGFRAVPGVEVIAIAGRTQHQANEAAARLRIAAAVDSVEKLLDQPIDAVSLALPPLENARAAALALSRKLPVLCEKPLSLFPEEARQLARHAGATTNVVDFQFAELDAFQSLRALLNDGACGALKRVHVTWLTESLAHRAKIWSWKTDRNLGGGALTLLGSHLLYLVEWLCGPISELNGKCRNTSDQRTTPPGRTPADDCVDVWFELVSGASGTASISNACPGGIGHRWELVLEDATAVLWNRTSDYMRGFSLELHTRGGVRTVYSDDFAEGGDGRLAPFVRLATRFVEAARLGTMLHPDFSDAARVAELSAQIQLISSSAVA